MPNDRELKFVS